MRFKGFTIIACLFFYCIHAQGQISHWQNFVLNVFPIDVKFFNDTATNSLYIFGGLNFSKNQNIYSDTILKWNGTSMQYISGLKQGGVGALMPFQNKLFATNNINIFVQDSNKWHNINNRKREYYGLFNINNKLYNFQDSVVFASPNTSCHYFISYWNGINWIDTLNIDTVFKGYGQTLNSLIEYKGELYVAGNIFALDHPDFQEIIRFDGKNWKSVGNGIPNSGLGSVRKLLIYKDDLYACGEFMESQGAPGNAIARWDGSNWQRLGDGLILDNKSDSWASDMTLLQGKLIVSGYFNDAGGIPGTTVAAWDGKNWCTLKDNFGGNPGLAIQSFNNVLIMYGAYKSIDGDSSYQYNNLAQWKTGNFGDSCSVPLSVQNIPELPNRINIFPNPTHNNRFKIQYESKTVFKNVAIVVTTSTGQTIFRKQFANDNSSFSTDISLPETTTGVYFLGFNVDGKLNMAKISLE